MKKLKVIDLILFLVMVPALHCAATDIRGTVSDAGDGEPLAFASVVAQPGSHAILTDAEGRFHLSLPEGKYRLITSYVGYRPDTIRVDTHTDATLIIRLTPHTYTLGEVMVTARENEALTSVSKIDRSAMQHLQPSSFADLLELLPGNISKDPQLTGANGITLRETGTIGATGNTTSNADYAMTSLGTSFVIDGAPVATDANLQTIGNITDATSPHADRNITNKGVDMRSISTDNIESVEIVRGIPGAEYGNLTSGVINIRRINRRSPLNARFKADGYSKLFYVGKGFRLGRGESILNLDLGYLDAKDDPRDPRDTYQRITASARYSLSRPVGSGTIYWLVSADYTGSVDNAKTDPDLSLRKVDIYKSTYNRGALTTELTWRPSLGWLDLVRLNASSSLQSDVLEQQRQVAPTHPTVAPTSMEEGIHDGHFILGEYLADYRSEGKPLNVFAKLTAGGMFSAGHLSASHKAGIEFSLDKNLGEGQIYDLTKPLSAGWTTRPRRYADIPGLRQLAGFVQEQLAINMGRAGSVDAGLGIRLQGLTGLNRQYKLSGKVYADPRFNLLWHIGRGWRVRPFVGGGYGLTTRMPTIDYLYPADHYTDLVQLNYYHPEDPVNLSRISLCTYIDPTANYDLKAARNRKAEIRGGFTFGANTVSVTYFDESLKSGYRYTSVYGARSYTLYDATSIDGNNLTTPPALEGLPYVRQSILTGHRSPSNGTRIDKRGVEFQIHTARWKPLRTALTVTGAWLHSVYTNSQQLFVPVSHVVDNRSISDMYIGLYDSNDGRVNNTLSTTFMFDTQLTEHGLVFTTSIQCMWFVKTRQMVKNGIPTAYISAADGMIHPFTPESAADPVLGKLVNTYNPDLFNTTTIPTALYINLKATKNIGPRLSISLFVNRLLDYLPDYKVNGLTIRRNSDAYFGMELNLKI